MRRVTPDDVAVERDERVATSSVLGLALGRIAPKSFCGAYEVRLHLTATPPLPTIYQDTSFGSNNPCRGTTNTRRQLRTEVRYVSSDKSSVFHRRDQKQPFQNSVVKVSMSGVLDHHDCARFSSSSAP